MTRAHRGIRGTRSNIAGNTSSGGGAVGPSSPPSNSIAPTATSAPTVGGYALLSMGTWTNNPTSFSTQIKRGGVAVGSPIITYSLYIGPSYTFVTADKGVVMTAEVTASNAKGSSSAQVVALGTPTYNGVYGSSIFGALGSYTGGGATLTQNAATAPDGTSTAASLLATATTGGHNMSITGVSRSAVIGFYRHQVYAKPINGYNVALRLDDGTSSNYITQIFDINTGVTKTTFAVGTGISVIGCRIIAVDNGYYRCEAMYRVEASRTTVRSLVQLADATFNVASFTGVATSGADMWSPQCIAELTPNIAPISATPQIIYDTAMCTDDSFDAFYYVCKEMDLSACNLLAATTSSSVPYSVSCLHAMLGFSGYNNTLLGAYQGSGRETADNYAQLVTNRFRPGDSRVNYPTALSVARRTLAAASNNSITYVCAGNLGNLQDLLLSPSDQYSLLNGKDLVASKVARLCLIAGNYPTGAEHNYQVLPAASSYVMANWPTEIVEIPFSIGLVYCRPPIGADPLVNPYEYAFENLPSGFYVSLTGVTSFTVTGQGTGGTDGTYAMSFSGGAGLGAAGTFTVSGGKVTATKLLAPGQNYTSAPTISLAAAPGLTGATITATTSAFNARSAWDGVTALIAVKGIDLTNMTWQGAYGVNVVDPATGSNTFNIQEPNNGKQQYMLYSGDGTVSEPTIASILNQVVFS